MKVKTVEFLITKKEKKILEEVCFLEPYLQDNLSKSRKEGEMIRISFDAYDLFDAISAVEYASDCIASPEQQSGYVLLLEKMKRYLNLVHEPGQQLGA